MTSFVFQLVSNLILYNASSAPARPVRINFQARRDASRRRRRMKSHFLFILCRKNKTNQYKPNYDYEQDDV